MKTNFIQRNERITEEVLCDMINKGFFQTKKEIDAVGVILEKLQIYKEWC